MATVNCEELKILRIRRNLSHREMGEAIRKSLDSYSKKERGEVGFSFEEALAAARKLSMTYDQFNDIFFGGDLPFRKWCASDGLSLNQL